MQSRPKNMSLEVTGCFFPQGLTLMRWNALMATGLGVFRE